MEILQNIGACAAIILNVVILVLVAINLRNNYLWSNKQKEYFELISAPHLLEDLKALKEVARLFQEKYNKVLEERNQERKLVNELQEEIERLKTIQEAELDPGTTTTLEAWDISAAKEIAEDLQKSILGDYISDAFKPLQEYTNKVNQTLEKYYSFTEYSKFQAKKLEAFKGIGDTEKPPSPPGG